MKHSDLKYITVAIVSITLLVYLLLSLGALIVQSLGISPGFAPQLQFRILGEIFICIGVTISIWVVLARGARNMLVSTGVTFIKLFGRFSIREIGGRNEQLVISGPQKYTRNPLYLGAIISFLGWSLMINSTSFVVGTCLVTIWIVLIQIPFEERELRALFGKDYINYSSTVPVLIPFTIPGRNVAAPKLTRTLHRLGGLLLVLIFLDSALGVASSVYFLSYITVIHVFLGILLITLSGSAFAISYRLHNWTSSVTSIFVFLTLCMAAVSGVMSIVFGNMQILAIDKMLALAALVASLLLVFLTSTASDGFSEDTTVSEIKRGKEQRCLKN